MLQVGFLTGRRGQPRADCVKEGRQDAAPAEPEHDKLQHVGTVGDRDGASVSKEDIKAFLKAVQQGVASAAEDGS